MSIRPVSHSFPDHKQIFKTSEKIIDFHVLCMAVTIEAQALQALFFIGLRAFRIEFKRKLCREKPFTKSLLHIHDLFESKRQSGAPGFEKVHATFFNELSLITENCFQIIVYKKECAHVRFVSTKLELRARDDAKLPESAKGV